MCINVGSLNVTRRNGAEWSGALFFYSLYVQIVQEKNRIEPSGSIVRERVWLLWVQ